MEKSNQSIVAFFTQLSALVQYAFPFFSIIIPLIIWSTSENKLIVKRHAAEVFNFQLSVLIYSIVLAALAFPFLIYGFGSFFTWDEFVTGADVNFTNYSDAIAPLAFGFIFIGLLTLAKAAEFFLIIYGAVTAARGGFFNYPLCIKFIKSTETAVLDGEIISTQ